MTPCVGTEGLREQRDPWHERWPEQLDERLILHKNGVVAQSRESFDLQQTRLGIAEDQKASRNEACAALDPFELTPLVLLPSSQVQLIRRVFALCHDRGVTLVALHVPREANSLADALSHIDDISAATDVLRACVRPRVPAHYQVSAPHSDSRPSP